MKHFWCWLTTGHIWERIGGASCHNEVWQEIWNVNPEEQYYMCVNCIKCVIIDVKNSKRVA